MRYIQKKKPIGFTLVELVFVLIIIGIAVAMLYKRVDRFGSASSSQPGGDQNVLKGSYSPPFLPLTLSVNTNGELQVSLEGRIITPVGTFSLEWERKKIYYLEVTLGNSTRFYPLGEHKFKIYLPNSLDGITSVRYDGEGNVRILVPKPGQIRFPN